MTSSLLVVCTPPHPSLLSHVSVFILENDRRCTTVLYSLYPVVFLQAAQVRYVRQMHGQLSIFEVKFRIVVWFLNTHFQADLSISTVAQ